MTGLSPALGIVLVLLAAFAWASWLPLVEVARPLPITRFMVPMYVVSLLLMWAAWAVLGEGGAALAGKIGGEAARLWQPLLGGFIFAFGIWLTLMAVRLAGVTVGFVLFTAIALVLGTVLSAVIEGVSPAQLPWLVVGCALILAAVPAIGVVMREREGTASTAPVAPLPRLLVIAVVGAACVSAYPSFMALAIASGPAATRLDPFEYMALAATGSLIGSLVLAAVRREATPAVGARRALALPAVAALCHYGGNLVNAIGAAAIGFAIAWPLGQTVLVWGTLWGFLRGEFRGATRRALIAVAASVALVAAGVAALSQAVAG